MSLLRKLLWVDCGAAALAGVAVLTLSGWLSEVYAVPQGLLLFTGAVNVAYACYSFSLAVRARRPLSLIVLLVVANLAWGIVCFGLATSVAGSATWFGVGHLIGEGAFVSGLAALEWSRRDLLTVA